MKSRVRIAVTMLSATILALPQIADAKPKYAKTEVERAAGKCVGSVLGGLLLGGLIGGLVDKKKGAVTGAAIGVGVGGIVCAVLMNNARHKDEIIAAQIAAANSIKHPYQTQFADDNGQVVAFTGQATNATYLQNALVPVKYKNVAGEKIVSPLPGAAPVCRKIDSALTYSPSERATLPTQVVCRDDEESWQPYGHTKT